MNDAVCRALADVQVCVEKVLGWRGMARERCVRERGRAGRCRKAM